MNNQFSGDLKIATLVGFCWLLSTQVSLGQLLGAALGAAVAATVSFIVTKSLAYLSNKCRRKN